MTDYDITFILIIKQERFKMGKKQKQVKPKNKRAQEKTIKVPPVAFVDNIVFSEKEVWAY